MLTIWYVGGHEKDGALAQIGARVTRFGQSRQKFRLATHCEAVLIEGGKEQTIASASLRDGGVRIKTIDLEPDHWVVLDVPAWDVVACAAWYEKKIASGVGINYSVIGAMSSASLLVCVLLELAGVDRLKIGQWCSRSLGESVGVIGAEDMNVAELMALAWNLKGTTDVTAEFFAKRAQA